MSSSVMPSSTPRTLARTATQVSRRRIVEPWYSMSSGAWPATEPSGPSTARITSATVMRSAGRASAWPAVGPAVARDDPGAAQLEQDVLQELLRDALGLGQPLGRDRRAGARRRELDERAHRVVHLRGDPHAVIVAGGERASGSRGGAAASEAQTALRRRPRPARAARARRWSPTARRAAAGRAPRRARRCGRRASRSAPRGRAQAEAERVGARVARRRAGRARSGSSAAATSVPAPVQLTTRAPASVRPSRSASSTPPRARAQAGDAARQRP